MRHALMGVAIIFIFIVSLGSHCGLDTDNSEANKVALEFWNAHLSKCGDSYYYTNSSRKFIDQFKGVSFSVTQKYLEWAAWEYPAAKLTEADKLNGIEWKGYTVMSYSARRTWYPPSQYSKGGWGDWITGSSRGKGLHIESMTKVKGKGWIFHRRWTTDANATSKKSWWKKIDCSQIPQ